MIPKASLKVVLGDPISVHVLVDGRAIAAVPIAEVKAAYQWICDLEVAAEFAKIGQFGSVAMLGSLRDE